MSDEKKSTEVGVILKPHLKKLKKPGRDFTWTLYDTNKEMIEAMFKKQKPKMLFMTFQKEECPETKKLHWQGYSYYESVRKLKAVIKEWQKTFKGAHIEVSRSGLRAGFYCMKNESRVEGPWMLGKAPKQGERTDLVEAKNAIQESRSWRSIVNNDELVPVVSKYLTWTRELYACRDLPSRDILRMEKWVTWQYLAFCLLTEKPVHRRIIWIWGNHSAGKTLFMQEMETRFDLLVGGENLKDTIHAYDGQEIIWFDAAKRKEFDREFSTMLEHLSNGGKILSGKYNSTQKFVDAHIVVTSNRKPIDLPKRMYELNLFASWGLKLGGAGRPPLPPADAASRMGRRTLLDRDRRVGLGAPPTPRLYLEI